MVEKNATVVSRTFQSVSAFLIMRVAAGLLVCAGLVILYGLFRLESAIQRTQVHRQVAVQMHQVLDRMRASERNYLSLLTVEHPIDRGQIQSNRERFRNDIAEIRKLAVISPILANDMQIINDSYEWAKTADASWARNTGGIDRPAIWKILLEHQLSTRKVIVWLEKKIDEVDHVNRRNINSLTDSGKTITVSIGFLIGLSLLIFFYSAHRLHREIKERQESERTLERERKSLENKVQQRTAILERKTLELEDERRSMRTLIQKLPGLIFRCKLDDRFTPLYVSDQISKIFDFEADEFLGAGVNWTDLIHPEDTLEVMAVINDLMANSVRYQSEFRIKQRSGNEIWVSASMQKIPDTSGATGILEGFVMDITGRKQADIDRILSSDRQRLALEMLHMGAWEVDLVTNKISWDAISRALYGISDDREITLDVFLSAVHPDDRSFVWQQIQASMLPDGSKGFRIEHRVIGIDDQIERWIESASHVYFDPGGKPVQAIGAVREVTELKRNEVRMAAYNRHTSVLASASLAFTRTDLGYQELLDLVAQKAVDALGGCCSIRIVSPDLDRLVYYSLVDRDPEFGEYLRQVIRSNTDGPKGGIVGGPIMDFNEPFFQPRFDRSVINDRIQATFGDILDWIQVHSLIVVPMQTRGQNMGVWVLNRHDPDEPPFNENDLSLARELADRAALAIQNLGLYRDLQNELDRRKQIESDLREERDRFARIVEAAPGAIHAIKRKPDGTWSFPFVSRQLETIFGIKAEILEADASPVMERTHPGDIELLTHSVRASAANLTPWHQVFRYRRDDGIELWIDAHSSPVREPDGSTQWFGVITDVTEERQKNERIRYQANLLESVSDAIIGMDLDYRITSWNHAAERLYGWQAGEVIGKRMEEIVSENADAGFLKEIREYLMAEGSWNGEVSQTTREGNRVTVLSSVTHVRDSLNLPIGVVAVNKDVTEMVRAEAALRKNEEWLRLAYESSDLGSLQYDVVSHVLELDERAQGHFSTEKNYLTPGEFLTRIHPEDRDRVREEFFRALDFQNLGHYRTEYRVIRTDEQVRWLSIHGHVYFEKTGQDIRPVLGVATSQDITERKLADENILRLNEELEQRVAERTAQLEVANKELEAFAYSISHDLRSPLRAIDGYTIILLEDYGVNLDDDGKRICGVIRNEAQRMGQLIDDLLAFSRLGRVKMQDLPVDMNALIEQILVELLPDPVPDHLEVRIQALPLAKGDPSLLRQVWINLLTNAIKFTSKKDRALIEIGAVSKDEMAVYYVRDNGAGFEMKYAHKLFGVFQRLHSDRDFEGTGVGLAIVQRIINRHGGTIWAEGEVNQGATFYFSLHSKM